MILHFSHLSLISATTPLERPTDLSAVEFLSKKLFDYLFGDKAYLSKKIFHQLYERGLKLITKIRSNMKNMLMLPFEKLMLRARGLIESVNNRLKNGCHIDHHRHRSSVNFLGNLFRGLIAYQLLPKKIFSFFSSKIRLFLYGLIPNSRWISGKRNRKKGRPKVYADGGILCLLMLKWVVHLTYRSLEGFAKTLMNILRIQLPIPSYTQISRRARKVKVPKLSQKK